MIILLSFYSNKKNLECKLNLIDNITWHDFNKVRIKFCLYFKNKKLKKKINQQNFVKKIELGLKIKQNLRAKKLIPRFKFKLQGSHLIFYLFSCSIILFRLGKMTCDYYKYNTN